MMEGHSVDAQPPPYSHIEKDYGSEVKEADAPTGVRWVDVRGGSERSGMEAGFKTRGGGGV